ncbi:hypothetical protein C9975_06345 [Thalassospira xiamenensis]|nr:hypothetical protein C9939_02125 [Pseudidiomarina aestuarii]PTC00653.1 hypothetical protein C9975_06345 [Thalassospira xiamenensis]
MPIVSLDQKKRRVSFSEFGTENDIVFTFFDKLQASERDEAVLRALYIGVLAMMEDRFSSFLARTSNELGVELESLKRIFDMKQELFYKTSIKGVAAEEDIAEYLKEFFEATKLKDTVELTGNAAGNLKRNKTGDILCKIDGSDDQRIVIECKFSKSIRMGDISSRDIFSRKSDTAWSQLIEADANRDGKVSILVLDAEVVDPVLQREVGAVKYLAGLGFIAIVDSQKGDYSNLSIAYLLSRDIATKMTVTEIDADLLVFMISALLRDIKSIQSIRKLVSQNIETNKQILAELEKSMMLLEFHNEYFSKFLKDGTLSKEDMLSFYNGGDVSDRFRLIEKEIKSLA